IRAGAGDYELFNGGGMRYRRDQNTPPLSRLIRLVHSHTNNATCETRAVRLAEELRSAQREADLANVEILGPTPPYPPRLRGRYRWHIVLRGREPRALLDMVSIPQGWTVDVDPVSLT
ncbi:MAG: primosomal protein N', partial [Dehalococcoidia bacterium]|nr:primosomal protein N' [Dehalococcoidia bacterium]